MAEARGKLLTCDRCQKTRFLKYLGDTELDGGFTQIANFEDDPDWQTHATVQGKYVTLCPACAEEWMNLGISFMGRELR